MRRLISSTLGLALVAAGVAHGQEGPALPAPDSTKIASPDPTANEKLAQAIANQLRANSKLKRYHVDVEVKDGVVELTGQVADTKQRDEVVSTIQAVPGVARIRDNLTTAAVASVLEASKALTKAATSEPPVATAKAAPASAPAAVVPAAPAAGAKVQEEITPVQTAAAPEQAAPAATQPLDLTPIQASQADVAPLQSVPMMAPMVQAPMMQPQYVQPQYVQPQYGQPQFVQPQFVQPQYAQPQYAQPQYVWAPVQSAVQPGMAPRAGMPPEPLPIFTAQPGMPNPNLQPPPLPPNAWPTFAPYNNVSRVAYPNNYPYEAWPFIGPMYPFPKVPLGWRNVTLGWRDGYWWYGRDASGHDWWRIRYW